MKNKILISILMINVALCLGFTAGCGIDLGYLIPQAAGQLDIIAGAVPIDQVLATGNLTEEEERKLRLIKDARLYGAEVIGLNIEDNYTMFYDTGGDPIAWNISASRRDRFDAEIWNFPLVGDIPYLGYFNQMEAAQKVYELEQEGLDVYMYPVDAYSTLDVLPNPVFSGMLDRPDMNIVETILHELLHATVWRAGDTTFNESLATFVGRNGTLSYLADRYPDYPEMIDNATKLYEDNVRFNDFFFEMYGNLDAFYNLPISQPEKLAQRDAMFQAERDRFAQEVQPLLNYPDLYAWVLESPTNNAWILANYRYNLDIELFENVYEATGNSWPESIILFRAAAQSGDPWQYLKDWLNTGESGSEYETELND